MKKILFLILFLTASCSKEENVNSDINKINKNNGSSLGCLAIDTDSDGLIDCEDPDIDNDGFINENDIFPKNPNEWIDTDIDGVGDNTDIFPLDSAEWSDNDGDFIGNNADPDDDNDGAPDIIEGLNLEFNNLNFSDIDNDGLPDQTVDPDDDNDGVPDIIDAFFGSKVYRFDTDNDGLANLIDDDIDNDGFFNLIDDFVYDNKEWIDTDNDLIGNNADPDDDNDGVPDIWDDYPTINTRMYDSDGDSYANEDDRFPYDSNEWIDTDNDGVGDNSDAFPYNPNEWVDTDIDGIGDNSDFDIDGDSYANCIPVNTIASLPCNRDAFPFDRFEWIDTDNDGIGDNSDPDIDNDKIPNVIDKFPLDDKGFNDFDNDGILDNRFPISDIERLNFNMSPNEIWFDLDPDTDNDGVPNILDFFPFNSTEYFDIDGDRIGNKTDLDDDGDGVLDIMDLFPFDPDEFGDNDSDGLGNNSDPDDDNDGSPDVTDVLPLNNRGYFDFNGDLVPDQVSNDLDGDGYPNGILFCTNNINEIICDYPAIGTGGRNDHFVFNSLEWFDLDLDTIGDNSDPDDDNDGAPDVFDDVTSIITIGYFDLDMDGIPNNLDLDLDNDGVDEHPEHLVCEVESFEIKCYYKYEQCFYVPELDDTLCTEYDKYPYDPQAQYDLDNDDIPDYLDNDIDGDGFLNCIPLDLSSPSPCNQDMLPYIDPLHDFVTSTFNDNGNQISYCKSETISNCFYVNYDTDNDGLTNYLEYLNETNPDKNDTDGDTVPDFNEIEEGTNPLDKLSFLDSDEDGTPNYKDITPFGANTEEELRKQINNASECHLNNSINTCKDTQTGLCKWVEDSPVNLIVNPDDPADPILVPSGTCQVNKIILTEDILLADCINLNVGKVEISSVKDRKKIIINQLTNSGPYCFGKSHIFNFDFETDVLLSDIEISSDFENVIYSEGALSFYNFSFIGENNKLNNFLNYNNNGLGKLTIQNSAFKSQTNATGAYNNLIKIDTKDLVINNSIFECLYGDNLNILSESCVSVFSETTTMNGNVFANQTLINDNSFDGYSLFLNESSGLSSIKNTRVYGSSKSYYEDINSLNKENFKIIDGSNTGIYNNGVLDTPAKLIEYDSLFDLNSTKLQCLMSNDTDYSNIHGAYFDPLVNIPNINTYINPFFSQITTNLENNGNFVNNADFLNWVNQSYVFEGDTYNPINNYGYYDSDEQNVILDPSNGVARKYHNTIDRDYIKIQFILESLTGLNKSGLKATVNLINTETNTLLRNYNISFGTDETVIGDDFDKVYHDFSSNLLTLNYKLKYNADPITGQMTRENINQIMLVISNNSDSSDSLIFDQVIFKKNDLKVYNYSGIKDNVCSDKDIRKVE